MPFETIKMFAKQETLVEPLSRLQPTAMELLLVTVIKHLQKFPMVSSTSSLTTY